MKKVIGTRIKGKTVAEVREESISFLDIKPIRIGTEKFKNNVPKGYKLYSKKLDKVIGFADGITAEDNYKIITNSESKAKTYFYGGVRLLASFESYFSDAELAEIDKAGDITFDPKKAEAPKVAGKLTARQRRKILEKRRRGQA